ncbi:embryonic stem cell-specific 5-hydroxymethylcytosine-binding protein [Podospora australis]|uniref:Embryonic stem cell-specific 5-hydroxymethylcytosine-binding protein n=1 Tax=Podospora australis TaxID=1536484 RepID=A0AAN7AL08_9PEZI|nr:embryonic stem cell-specific 5-hydroxymethylcytosine-binding protein [Podospora australis]
MCGRYAMALRPSQVRRMLEAENMAVDDAPVDEGDGAPRQSYNFAPGYHGVVYRADAAYHADSHHHNENDSEPDTTEKTKNAKTHYKLQSMKWGLIPSWTARNPDYTSLLKTINCRDDSLAQKGGMWASMKTKKRCVVVAEGFYEWLKTGPKEKVPHFVKRKDGKLMLFAGLWDCASFSPKKSRTAEQEQDEGEQEREREQVWTYTVITTDSNAQLKFLHDRMPVILDPGSEELRTWLDPEKQTWDKELQGILKPYQGELEVYAVSKEVGKVGNNSPSFVIPVASRENKSNIANFFAAAAAKGGDGKGGVKKEEAELKVKEEAGDELEPEVEIKKENADGNESLEVKKVGDIDAAATPAKKGIKREASPTPIKGGPLTKKPQPVQESPVKKGFAVSGRPKISATRNPVKSPSKTKKGGGGDGSQKITKFFGNSA